MSNYQICQAAYDNRAPECDGDYGDEEYIPWWAEPELDEHGRNIDPGYSGILGEG